MSKALHRIKNPGIKGIVFTSSNRNNNSNSKQFCSNFLLSFLPTIQCAFSLWQYTTLFCRCAPPFLLSYFTNTRQISELSKIPSFIVSVSSSSSPFVPQTSNSHKPHFHFFINQQSFSILFIFLN